MNKLETNTLQYSLLWSILLLSIVWGVHIINITFPEFQLNTWGNLPRDTIGLRGILFSPFLHDTKDWMHISNNSISFFVLFTSLVYFFKKIWWKVFIFITLFSGIWVWLIGRESYHIGLSGVIYGLMSFLFFSGVFRKNTNLLGLSLFVAFEYGSMVWGIFPVDPKISFEGHSGGFVIGILMASFYKTKGPKNDEFNLTVDPEFEEFVEQYNVELLNQHDNTNLSDRVPTFD